MMRNKAKISLVSYAFLEAVNSNTPGPVSRPGVALMKG